jgi:hypothetical protein
MQKVFAIASDNIILPIVQTGISVEEAKRNTLLFIGGMTLFLLVLVGIGYLLEKRKIPGKKNLSILMLMLIHNKLKQKSYDKKRTSRNYHASWSKTHRI